jgi:hypothetical protein
MDSNSSDSYDFLLYCGLWSAGGVEPGLAEAARLLRHCTFAFASGSKWPGIRPWTLPAAPIALKKRGGAGSRKCDLPMTPRR